ncbi:hypothetical protein NEOLI_003201 [Neolecta irregularis DAH-3]|uniref:Uncharacterized protein n=1 Tax=Neolecta irregularis (strain DAH-3) TaxID=1198029 RepID=A0A1U7LST5_NEOID|nr:hypothetical protein NEOLI_003201 [Neolecta irregularis DAH-3]|eukprot:OLL25678.1 hypothetical protein NEOLI_003201 [Neolecta irregularis DAH-3]
MSSFDSNPYQESEDERPESSGSSTPMDTLVFNVSKIEDVPAQAERHMIEINGEIIWSDINIAKERSKYIRRELQNKGTLEDAAFTSTPVLRLRLPCEEAVVCICEYLKNGDIAQITPFDTDKTLELKALLVNGRFLDFTNQYWEKFYRPLLKRKIAVAWNGMWWSYPTISETFLVRVLPTIYGVARLTASIVWYNHTITLNMSLEGIMKKFMSDNIRNLCADQISKIPPDKVKGLKERHAKAMQLLLTDSGNKNVKPPPVTVSTAQSTLKRLEIENQTQKAELSRLNLKIQHFRCPRCHKSIPRAAKDTQTCIHQWHIKPTITGKDGVIKWICCGKIFEEGKVSGCRFEISNHIE